MLVASWIASLLSEEGCRKLAALIRVLEGPPATGPARTAETIPDTTAVSSALDRPGSEANRFRNALEEDIEEPPVRLSENMPANGRRRARRGSFNPTKDQLATLPEQFTAREIGAKFGVSAQTVAIKAKALGLTTPRAPQGAAGGRKRGKK
jgi:hypothetical protein